MLAQYFILDKVDILQREKEISLLNIMVLTCRFIAVHAVYHFWYDLYADSRKIEQAGGYQFNITQVPNTFVFSPPS